MTTLCPQPNGRDWREAYPRMFEAYGDLFNYAAEEAWLAARDA